MACLRIVGFMGLLGVAAAIDLEDVNPQFDLHWSDAERLARMTICSELNQEYKDAPSQKAAFAFQDQLRRAIRPGEKADWKNAHYVWLLSCYMKLELELGGAKPEYSKDLGLYLFESSQYTTPKLETRHAHLLAAAKWTEPVIDFDPSTVDTSMFGVPTPAGKTEEMEKPAKTEL